MDDFKFDNEIEIFYDDNERNNYQKQSTPTTIEYLKVNFPKAINFLSEHQIKTISNQKHFANLWAMNHFIDRGYNAFYIESGYITKKNIEIRKIISENFTSAQSEYLIAPRMGGIPDLLVKINDKWLFAEVKLETKIRKDELTKKQKEIFPKIQELGIRLDLAKLVPINSKI